MSVPEPSAPVRAAWQGALAAEHQAVFGYTVLGPKLSGTQRQRVVDDAGAHTKLRDATAAAIARAGAVPVTALPDYPALYPVPDAAAARRLAVRLEEACADAWRYLYLRAASADDGYRTLRSPAQDALTASAVRATLWRVLVSPTRATDAFPGL